MKVFFQTGFFYGVLYKMSSFACAFCRINGGAKTGALLRHLGRFLAEKLKNLLVLPVDFLAGKTARSRICNYYHLQGFASPKAAVFYYRFKVRRQVESVHFFSIQALTQICKLCLEKISKRFIFVCFCCFFNSFRNAEFML